VRSLVSLLTWQFLVLGRMMLSIPNTVSALQAVADSKPDTAPTGFGANAQGNDAFGVGKMSSQRG